MREVGSDGAYLGDKMMGEVKIYLHYRRPIPQQSN